ncbi:type I-E CRISPR-associated protein Cse1/CasA [Streptococcus chenjunshii]|uniref:Type I-E CRISPR-associated protein Cse1/CasA n=1 Tax=Streptococcus chenjunshii TaxID=2173853 RepID=A0A372KPY2_9STRE|nr:type I-E CRISPR-associated protein Cse1/CasA [Streptococcus chenjunshii]AXQ79724.1 type I-E CRISPR-associated protein Cse1/CasA [Streptococcus chenjunshii]RFU52116.1 type I-E CRISPR-associated protein Cse1/CasA [Streptococcus chenjunshii]RFU54311.1 type I-E CRISPR-associated protein Cse1/CasA [Streptococcus chenjunshii]
MSRFNLLDEPWISVVYDERGHTKEVSFLELFANAHQYKDLAGDTKTQDFAVLRVLLAVLHTVFSRFDADGKPYDYLEVDEQFRQVEAVEEEDIEDYEADLYDTWVNLWEQGQFPDIVSQYLEKWRNRFYLFDEDYPFFQVRKEDIKTVLDLEKTSGTLYGKNINRLISESENTYSIFSPKYGVQKNNDLLTESEMARWLLTYQGYSGAGDKKKFTSQSGKHSIGWLYGLGGVYLCGNNLFETLLFNFILPYNELDNLYHIQKPCWEFKSSEMIELVNIDNIASLYTVWSRGIYINPKIDTTQPFSCRLAKIGKVNEQDNFLEPMSLWKYNKIGVNRNTFTPQKHISNQALWRSFGLLAVDNVARKPGIIDWLRDIREELGNKNIIISAVSMKDDDNVTSKVPTDEIIDSLSINDFVVTDLEEGGWVPRINDTVEETKKVISRTYKKYIDDIKEIRNISSNSFTSQKVEELYFKIDQPFRQWLASIQHNDEKDVKVMDWRKTLKNLVEDEAKTLLSDGGNRDYIGIVEGKSVKNIATAYNEFSYWLSQNLK